MPALPPHILYILALILSATISVYAVRKLIFITRKRKIYDVPDDIRKIHGAEIPTLGGIGIFIGYVIVAAFFWPRYYTVLPFILASSAILFFTGIYDDIMNMRPSKKLMAQLIASFVTVYFANIRIESLYGIFGIEQIPYWMSIALAMLCCTFFINVFNFIDGIDGLACVLAILYTGLLAVMFIIAGRPEVAGISLALLGATAGLLYFNRAPAKIYMGDTGSMFLGFSIFIFSLLLVNACVSASVANNTAGFKLYRIGYYIHGPQQAMLFVFGLLFPPVFDGIRVFLLRTSRGISPLKADRTHLHYYLLDAGFTHSRAVAIIAALNVLTISVALLTQDMHYMVGLGLMTLLSLATVALARRLRRARTMSR